MIINRLPNTLMGQIIGGNTKHICGILITSVNNKHSTVEKEECLSNDDGREHKGFGQI